MKRQNFEVVGIESFFICSCLDLTISSPVFICSGVNKSPLTILQQRNLQDRTCEALPGCHLSQRFRFRR